MHSHNNDVLMLVRIGCIIYGWQMRSHNRDVLILSRYIYRYIYGWHRIMKERGVIYAFYRKFS